MKKRLFLEGGFPGATVRERAHRYQEESSARRFFERDEMAGRGKKERRKGEAKSRCEPWSFLSASQTAAKGNTLYMPTTFPKCSVQFFAATSAGPDERVTHGESNARAYTHVLFSTHTRNVYDFGFYLCTCTFRFVHRVLSVNRSVLLYDID